MTSENEQADPPYPSDDSMLPPNGQGAGFGGHGTKMLGELAGLKKGAAKRVKPILVRTPRRNARGSQARAEDYVDGVGKVLEDLNSAKNPDNPQTRTRAILSMSWYVRPGNIEAKDIGGLQKRLNDLLKAIVAKGVLPITASGNNYDIEITGVPALYGLPNPEGFGGATLSHIPELLVVGAVNAPDGNIWHDDTGHGTNVDEGGGLPHIYAPGQDIAMAYGDKTQWKSNSPGDASLYITESGTSPATALTAGLAAYFVGLTVPSRNRLSDYWGGEPPAGDPGSWKQFIIDRGYDRGNPPRRGIWNLVTQAKREAPPAVCAYTPGAPLERRGALPSTDGPESYWMTNVTILSVRQDSQESDDWPLATTCITAESSTTTTSSSSSSSSSSTVSSTTSTTTSDTSLPPLPTLTTTSTTSPSGSTCVSSATSTSCAYEGGGHSVCVSNSYCATWSALPTPTFGELKCNEEFSHGDIQRDTQSDYSTGFCNQHSKSEKTPDDTWADATTLNLDLSAAYYFSVKWIDGCVLSVDSQAVNAPLGGTSPDCFYIMNGIYRYCNDNGGAGGYVDVGCLRYIFSACPDDDCDNIEAQILSQDF
ncbi:peptidase S8/S53 domain-containing protein [Hypoxylon sp. FL1284]|nr:peptidase S8/S53 domain-containing protein [Hypoxylon sp. FL1284]